ncbi:MFS transporter [Streptomyces kaniharaensis]|uniref:MFS transporter n=1 Tax=Streptomyces kaniharaensis TaxID=212423 RepID=UPI002DDD4433|nr:MFS transporter [Streptomyces kaniharaensis]
MALPLIAVVTLHATALEVGLLTGAGYLAWLLVGLPAGVLVHLLPLRGTQVAMDLVRGAAVASVPLAAALGVLGLPQLVVVALVVGLASVVFDVGNSTFLPSIVAREELTARNSLVSGSAAATQLAGPSLGGMLVQLLGGATSMLLDAVSYAVEQFSNTAGHGVLMLRPAGAAVRLDGAVDQASAGNGGTAEGRKGGQRGLALLDRFALGAILLTRQAGQQTGRGRRDYAPAPALVVAGTGFEPATSGL